MRTGASAAVSAKWMARKNSKNAIVGAGHMAAGTLATCDDGLRLGRGSRVEPVTVDAR